MAALFNFPNWQQGLLQLDKVPFEDIWLGTIQVSQRDLTGALPVINIFEKPVFSAKPVPCKPVEYTQRYTIPRVVQLKKNRILLQTKREISRA